MGENRLSYTDSQFSRGTWALNTQEKRLEQRNSCSSSSYVPCSMIVECSVPALPIRFTQLKLNFADNHSIPTHLNFLWFFPAACLFSTRPLFLSIPSDPLSSMFFCLIVPSTIKTPSTAKLAFPFYLACSFFVISIVFSRIWFQIISSHYNQHLTCKLLWISIVLGFIHSVQ